MAVYLCLTTAFHSDLQYSAFHLPPPFTFQLHHHHPTRQRVYYPSFHLHHFTLSFCLTYFHFSLSQNISHFTLSTHFMTFASLSTYLPSKSLVAPFAYFFLFPGNTFVTRNICLEVNNTLLKYTHTLGQKKKVAIIITTIHKYTNTLRHLATNAAFVYFIQKLSTSTHNY